MVKILSTNFDPTIVGALLLDSRKTLQETP